MFGCKIVKVEGSSTPVYLRRLFVNHNTHGEEEDGEAVKISGPNGASYRLQFSILRIHWKFEGRSRKEIMLNVRSLPRFRFHLQKENEPMEMMLNSELADY
ncbi:hypothetical protein Tco_0762302 [Tanacetum coccineum]